MPIYPFFCDCGFKIDLNGSVDSIPLPPKCPKCGQKTFRNYAEQGCGIVLNGLGWARDGYSGDIDDAEDKWLKDGKKVGHWAGTDRGYPKDPTTGRIDKTKIPGKKRKKKPKLYVP